MFHHDDYIWKIIDSWDIYEQAILNELPSFSGIVVDVGANIWTHSIYFSKRWYVVHAFEPISKNFDLLQKNVKWLSVVCRNVALWENKWVMNMIEYPENMGMCRRSYKWDSVIVKTLDSIWLINVWLIKIDVEWMEDEVIKWAKNTILYNKPIIMVEMNKDLDSILLPLWYIKHIQIKTNAIYFFNKV